MLAITLRLTPRGTINLLSTTPCETSYASCQPCAPSWWTSLPFSPLFPMALVAFYLNERREKICWEKQMIDFLKAKWRWERERETVQILYSKMRGTAYSTKSKQGRRARHAHPKEKQIEKTKETMNLNILVFGKKWAIQFFKRLKRFGVFLKSTCNWRGTYNQCKFYIQKRGEGTAYSTKTPKRKGHSLTTHPSKRKEMKIIKKNLWTLEM